jgi:hypothetical protein
VDNFLIIRPHGRVLIAKNKTEAEVDCDDVGEIKEYIGCKVERDLEQRYIRLTQPVMLQSFKDEFGIDEVRTIQASAGDRLKQGDASANVGFKTQSEYRSGVGKLLHMMHWS